LLVVEDELIDSYVGDELTAGRRERFEEWFLRLAERREKVEYARSLARYAKLAIGAAGQGTNSFQTSAGIGFSPTSVGEHVATPPVPPTQRAWKWIAVGAVLVVMATAGSLFRDRFLALARNIPAIRVRERPDAIAHKPVTVMIADFNNHTRDQIFDGTLELTLKLALEGAGFISAYDRVQLRSLGVAPVDKLDETAAAKIALSQDLGSVISGSLERQGSSYALALKATQAVTGATIANAQDTAANKYQVLFALTKAASAIRKGLGDSSSDSNQRFAGETLTAVPLESLHEYAQAMDALSSGKEEEALKGFLRAVDFDPGFGLAYAGMAIASINLDRHQDAEKYLREALQHLDRMTERERYRTRATYYFFSGDLQKCSEEYGLLLARYPSDVAAHNNLGICYAELRNMPKALEEMQRAADILPKKAIYRFNHALYQAYSGNFQTAENEVRAALRMNPAYLKGYLTLAYSQLGQNQLDQAQDTYRALEKTSDVGASLAASGFADIAVYEGRYNDAVRILEKAAATDLTAGKMDLAADKFTALAYVQTLRGQKGPAVAASQRALDLSSSVKTRFLAARTFVEGGETAKAKTLQSALAHEIVAEPQAYARLIEGEIALKGGDPRAAVQSFVQANILLDTWIGHFDLGRAYLEIPAFTEADSEFDRCIKRRGEATEVFMDDVPTYGYLSTYYGYFPAVYYYQGRVREGLRSSAYPDSYRKYLDIRGKSHEDPLLSEVRRRAAGETLP
jgi:tetratricopeptide (TPR) repeat protein